MYVSALSPLGLVCSSSETLEAAKAVMVAQALMDLEPLAAAVVVVAVAIVTRAAAAPGVVVGAMPVAASAVAAVRG